ncbi:histidine kinase [Streptomyces scopuliridis]|uniref:histidine kinase n=1 Tax=Streptomyces scopuliridis TaxID=452529 RepID=UPI00368A7C4E
MLGPAVVGAPERMVTSDSLPSAFRERIERPRDLHDLVAHHVTGIVVQANAARSIRETAPEQIDPILENIQKRGMETLDSMRRLVQVLREVDGGRLRVVAAGRANQEVCAELFLALGSVKTHPTNIQSKLANVTAWRSSPERGQQAPSLGTPASKAERSAEPGGVPGRRGHRPFCRCGPAVRPKRRSVPPRNLIAMDTTTAALRATTSELSPHAPLRITALDALRGILLVNIPDQITRMVSHDDHHTYPISALLDLCSTQRFFPIFSFLFGLSLVISWRVPHGAHRTPGCCWPGRLVALTPRGALHLLQSLFVFGPEDQRHTSAAFIHHLEVEGVGEARMLE